MALSMINHFVLDKEELRVPFLLLDSVVIYGFHRYERQLRKEHEDLETKLAHQANVQHEAEKRDKSAQKLANRAQQKAEQKNMRNVTSKHANFSPANNIQQPDKAKKL